MFYTFLKKNKDCKTLFAIGSRIRTADALAKLMQSKSSKRTLDKLYSKGLRSADLECCLDKNGKLVCVIHPSKLNSRLCADLIGGERFTTDMIVEKAGNRFYALCKTDNKAYRLEKLNSTFYSVIDSGCEIVKNANGTSVSEALISADPKFCRIFDV